MSETITIVCGDMDFQKTLTEREKAYIHAGGNWIAKLGRECSLRSWHALGYTLDEIDVLPKRQKAKVLSEANRCWNRQNWSGAKYGKPLNANATGAFTVNSGKKRLSGFYPNDLPVGKTGLYSLAPIFSFRSNDFAVFGSVGEAARYIAYIRSQITGNGSRYENAMPGSTKLLMDIVDKLEILYNPQS